MRGNYYKHAQAVDHRIRDLVTGIDPVAEGLSETSKRFVWLGEESQPNFEQQVLSGACRLCWLEMSGHQHANVRPAGHRMIESAILNVGYPAGAHMSPAQATIMMRADSFALFHALHIKGIKGTVLKQLRATQSRVITSPGVNEVVAAYIHQIPLQWEQVLT